MSIYAFILFDKASDMANAHGWESIILPQEDTANVRVVSENT